MKNLPYLGENSRPQLQRCLKPFGARYRSRFPESCVHHTRRAFTLVELLVVLLIMLILIAVTVASYNFSVSADRVRAGARQFQSFLAGARDKAIYAKEIRGVRLLLDPNDNHSVNAMQYIGSPTRETGVLTCNPSATNNDSTGYTVALIPSTGISWTSLYNRGLLRIGTLIQIPSNTGTWYTVAFVYTVNISGTPTTLISLNRPVGDLAGSNATVGFVLQLAPAVLGEAQPIPLPSGVVIDLDGSNVPSSWRPSIFTNSYASPMDILFTPRGTVVGDALTVGMLHLHFADVGDVANWHPIVSAANPTPSAFNTVPFVLVNDPTSATQTVKRDRILATLAPRTGSVSVHYVNAQNSIPAPANANPLINYAILAYDPYSFAETGQVANK